jgi:hypothetical protein
MYPRRLRAAALERSAREEYQDFSNRTGGPHICAARGCTKIATDDGRLNADSGSDNPLYFCEEHYPEALGFYHEYKNIEPIIFPRNDFGTMLLHANDQSPSKKSTRNWWVTMSVNRHYKLLCHLRARLSREERAVLVRKAWWVHSRVPWITCMAMTKIPIVEALRFAADARDNLQNFIKIGIGDYNHSRLPLKLRLLALRVLHEN